MSCINDARYWIDLYTEQPCAFSATDSLKIAFMLASNMIDRNIYKTDNPVIAIWDSQNDCKIVALVIEEDFFIPRGLIE